MIAGPAMCAPGASVARSYTDHGATSPVVVSRTELRPCGDGIRCEQRVVAGDGCGGFVVRDRRHDHGVAHDLDVRSRHRPIVEPRVFGVVGGADLRHVLVAERRARGSGTGISWPWPT